MDPGDIGASAIAREIWTAVYTEVDGAERPTFMLFTVAQDQLAAERAFESYLIDEEGAEGDVPAPDTSVKIDFLPGESCRHVTTRLHQLGYTFVLPRRSQLGDDEVADLTRVLLRRTDIE